MFANVAAVMIGMPTGEASGIVVLDVDQKENRQGMDWLNENSHRMVQTRTVRTGSGGLHIYFRHPGRQVKNQNDKIAPGIDVRGDGGYVIVPPTVQQYWVNNATSGAFSLFVRTSAGTPVEINQGAKGIYYCDGSAIVLGSDPTTLSTPIVIGDGGTGATTASAARLNLGITIWGKFDAKVFSYSVVEVLDQMIHF
jgi:hypothetical protein